MTKELCGSISLKRILSMWPAQSTGAFSSNRILLWLNCSVCIGIFWLGNWFLNNPEECPLIIKCKLFGQLCQAESQLCNTSNLTSGPYQHHRWRNPNNNDVKIVLCWQILPLDAVTKLTVESKSLKGNLLVLNLTLLFRATIHKIVFKSGMISKFCLITKFCLICYLLSLYTKL